MDTLRLRPHKTAGKYATWAKYVGTHGGMCFTITWGRLTQLVEHDKASTTDFTNMFANRLKENEFVERFEADANGVTVFIGNKTD